MVSKMGTFGQWRWTAAVIVTVLFSAATMPAASAQECPPPEERVDCHPDHDQTPTEARCLVRGCDWCPDAAEGVPSCITRPDYGYNMDSLSVEDNGYRALLHRASIDSSLFGGDYEFLTANFIFESDYRLRIRIAPEGEDRFEVPVKIHPPAPGSGPGPSPNVLYSINFVNRPTFGFQVVRRATNTSVFDTTLGGLTFADQFIQLGIKLPSAGSVYGLGENEQHSLRQNFTAGHVFGLYTRDSPPNGETNMYGAQPTYTVVEDEGSTHSVVILNSAAQEFVLHPAPAYIYRTIGGLLDIYIVLGPTPEQAAAQVHEALGRMPLPPYWALGFQLCKFGYQNLEHMQAAVNRTALAGIPQDVQYADLDNLDRYLSFTYDPVRFADLPSYVRELKAKGIRFVISTEAYISVSEPNYKPLELGHEMDVWVKRPNGTNFLARTHFMQDPPCLFPDFTKNATGEWWTELVTEFHDVIEFDGLWLDMNEPATVGDQSCDPESSINHPPYVPAIRDRNLNSGTICADAVHAGGLHSDLHSVYALQEAQATRPALQAATGKRGFILTRSNYLSVGQHAAHWLGDNFANWENLRYSIIGTLQYNLFGVPLVGPDICAWFQDVDEELCTRWIQVGAFYPFARSHTGGHDRDPGVWGPESVASSRRVFLIRYTLLPYLYTLFYQHAKSGGTVARALWSAFPADRMARDVDTQFMWGTGLLISPALYEGATTVEAYFPASRWYSYYDGAELPGSTGEGQYITLDAPFDFLNLHLHGGSILPTQDPLTALNTEQARDNPYGLIVALDEDFNAAGAMYLDDGDSIDPLTTGAYFELEFTASRQQLQSRVVHSGPEFAVAGKVFNTIRVLGHNRTVSTVTVNGLFHDDFTLSPSTGELLIRNMNAPLDESLNVVWI